MKAVAYITLSFPVLSETFVGTEMRAMQRRGHRVASIAFKRHAGPAQRIDRELAERTHYLTDQTAWDALGVILVPRPSTLEGLRFAFAQRGLRPRSLILSALKLAALVRRERCEHIHAHFTLLTAAAAIVAARLLGITCSFVGHGTDVYKHPIDLPLKLASADLAVAVCADMQRDMQTMAPGARVGLVHCGIEPERFQPVAGTLGDLRRFLFVGRLIECKGVQDLIDAISLLPAEDPVRLDVVGDGPMRDAREQRARDAGVARQVRFLGAKPAEWLQQQGPRYLAFAGAFKRGSDGTRDTGPVVVKEAMAMGLPIVATTSMGLKEMLGPECALQTTPGDVPALAEALRSVSAYEPAQLHAMGDAARRRVMRLFTADAQSAELSALIESV